MSAICLEGGVSIGADRDPSPEANLRDRSISCSGLWGGPASVLKHTITRFIDVESESTAVPNGWIFELRQGCQYLTPV